MNGPFIDALFVKLKTSEAEYSTSTMSRDYPISLTLFHRASHATTSLASDAGQRDIRGDSSTLLLFVRRKKRCEFGTASCTYLGAATHVSHTGERPSASASKPCHPMPSDPHSQTSLAVG